MKKLLWILSIFFSISIGLYPLAYLFADMSGAFLSTKPEELLSSLVWSLAFYVHIGFGGVALLVGWLQFVKRFRNRYLSIHRNLGKVYLVSIGLSGISGLYIAFFATGGVIPITGFSGLAIAWMFTTYRAYTSILERNTNAHEAWMIRSYAMCFAAVTLRIWLPLMQFGMGIEFINAYRIVAWLCWVPNLFVAEMIVRSVRTVSVRTAAVDNP